MTKIVSSLQDPAVAARLTSGGLVVLPSDTQYGIVCQAASQDAVERVYAARGRTPTKPCVVLAASLEQLLDLEGLDRNTLLMAERYWPGPVSVVVPCKKSFWPHIHRGSATIAVRVPDNSALLNLLESTGPLLAPSANKEGEEPAETVAQAAAVFGDLVDIYVDGGLKEKVLPSTVIRFDEDGLVTMLRHGAVTITENGDIS